VVYFSGPPCLDTRLC